MIYISCPLREIKLKCFNYFVRVIINAVVRTHKSLAHSYSKFFFPPYLLMKSHSESELILCGPTDQRFVTPSIVSGVLS